jgi:integrase
VVIFRDSLKKLIQILGQLVMRGASLKAVQELLGHADLKMTMRYAHLSQEDLKNYMSTGKEMVNITPKAKGA